MSDITPIWPPFVKGNNVLFRKSLLFRLSTDCVSTNADSAASAFTFGLAWRERRAVPNTYRGSRAICGSRARSPSPLDEYGEPPECISLPEPVGFKRPSSPDRLGSLSGRPVMPPAPDQEQHLAMAARATRVVDECGQAEMPSNQSAEGPERRPALVPASITCDALGVLGHNGSPSDR